MPTPVLMYSRGWCGFCAAARELLAAKRVTLDEVDLDEHPEREAEMIERSGRTSVPQIFVGPTHVGGFTDLAALDRAGRLDPLLAGNPSS
jgi:glutaredoxin 3